MSPDFAEPVLSEAEGLHPGYESGRIHHRLLLLNNLKILVIFEIVLWTSD